MPYILKQINVPVFGTLLTLGLLENKLREHKMLDSTTRHTVVPGEKVKLGQMVVEFIHTNHSIADAVALAIHTPVGVVVHTGDFKVDYTPIDGDVIDLQRFAALGKEGVLLLMSDSTNAERRGFTMSEKNVGKVFEKIFEETPKNRIMVGDLLLKHPSYSAGYQCGIYVRQKGCHYRSQYGQCGENGIRAGLSLDSAQNAD